MGVLSKVTDFVGGSLFKEIKEGVLTYFPPSMSEQEKTEATLAVERFIHEKQIETSKILNESAAQLDKRISEQEGTASDLKSMPIIGSLVLFLRGLQRPVWGFAVLLMDFRWFFGVGIQFTERQELALMIINILVLGFLFGERAVQNLTPMIVKVWGSKSGDS